VVLCPPLAVEQASTKPALAQLSAKLADEGYAVLRFDYDGTGDSAGRDEDAGRLDAWLGSVRAALDAVAGLGCTRTVAVGLRMGALLAMVELRRRGGADAAVLWDPCVSGRSFMRQQEALRRMVDRGAIRQDGSVECLGTVLSPEAVAELGPLDLGDQGSAVDRMLVLTRSGRSVPGRVRQGLDGPGVECAVADGQEELVDVEPVRATVPEPTLDRIVAWVAGPARSPFPARGRRWWGARLPAGRSGSGPSGWDPTDSSASRRSPRAGSPPACRPWCSSTPG
jgi:pimeloyl-ACP methyl ester carboxylesterase